MKRAIQLTLFLGVAIFLLSACAQQTTVETSTTTEESITINDDAEETESETKLEEGMEITEEEESSDTSSENTITITSSGFSPSTLTVTQGTTVTFINKDSSAHRPATNPHPAHTGYPEEGTCSGSAFDSCSSLGEGESWSFTFDEIGEWDYHDHLNSGLSGTIIVE
ncbi:hypothetical protein EXS74_01715 [Candidatus Woesearchaeota archaeon]|nr:hypothetical protein [Candidatus Woesearchaeota archaeon]